MTDTIIDINKVKMLKESDRHVTPKNLQIKLAFVEVAEELIQNFLTLQINDLTQYFCNKLPKEVLDDFIYRSYELKNALENLNILSAIERKIGLNPVVFSPTCTDANLTGWIAGFNMAECVFSSPELKTEAMARAFNILLFLKLRNVLKA